MFICLILANCQFWKFLQYLTISVKFNNFRMFGNLSNLDNFRRNNISNFLRGHSLKRIFRLVYSFLARSTSTGNIATTKIENLRRSSDHEILHSSLCEVSKVSYSYCGGMLKKPNLPKKRTRSRSIDATAHYRIK